MKISAIIVWYKPSADHIQNTIRLAKRLNNIIIIDNSENQNTFSLGEYDNITYIPLGRNYGIAHALNIGCQTAIRSYDEFVLMLDQDSSFENDQLLRHVRQSEDLFVDPRLALIGPTYLPKKNPNFVKAESVITSGSIMRLSCWELIGGFNEILFIDQVDHEFCYRLVRNNFYIIKNEFISFNHTIGNPISIFLLGKRFTSLNYSPERRYYMTRNRLYMRSFYADFPRPYIRLIIEDAIRIIMVEKDIFEKLKFMIYGILDHFKSKYGICLHTPLNKNQS